MRWYIVAVGIFIISSTIFFLRNSHSLSVAAVYNTAASYCMYPIIKTHTNIVQPCRALFGSFENYADLLNAHTLLQEQYVHLQGECISLQAMQSYSVDVQKELDWFQKRFKLSGCHVVPIMAVHQTDRQHTMLIEGGAMRGFTKDMIVLASNVLLGKVITVYPWYCVVQLITDPASWVAVYGVCSNSHGLVRGTGDATHLLLERVEHLSPVQEEELLLSSGDGTIVPRGYGLGIVESYNSDGLYYTGRVKTIIDPNKLRTCLVVNREELLKNKLSYFIN